MMIIKKIEFYPRGDKSRKSKLFEFDASRNYIFSTYNGTGKSTLVRFILYGLCFDIPATRKVKFTDYVVTTTLDIGGKDVKIIRDSTSIHIEDNTFVLPQDAHLLHSYLFGITNTNLLNNLLGTIYFDQEKGWTLLNRGTVIGKNKFHIEEFLQGLKGSDELLQLEATLEKKNQVLEKYKSMKAVALYKDKLANTSGVIEVHQDIDKPSRRTELEKDKLGLLLEKEKLEKEISEYKDIIKGNKSFLAWLERYRIHVKCECGQIVEVSKNTLEDYNDNEELNRLEIKRREIQLQDIKKKIAKIENEIDEDHEIHSQLFTPESIAELYDKRVVELPVETEIIEKSIGQLNKEIKELKEKINLESQKNNDWLIKLNQKILHYSKMLKVDGYIDTENPCVFTDIKSLSGAIYHKLVFSYRLSYNLILSEQMGYNLPLFIDSPAGREVESSAVKEMISILKRDFSAHQLFIASIHDFCEEDGKQIVMNGDAFEFADTAQLEFDF